MTREQLHTYCVGDRVVDYGDKVASIHEYVARCSKCGQWLGATTIAHGSLGGDLMCSGEKVARRRVTVTIFEGPSFSPFRWRRATPQERKEVLRIATNREKTTAK